MELHDATLLAILQAYHFGVVVSMVDCYHGVHDNNQPLTLQPQNGMLAIWPAILHHEVPPTKGRRMCISMNIDKGERK